MRVTLVLALAGSALAFPAAVMNGLDARAAKALSCPFAAEAVKQKRQAWPDTAFDPVQQKVDVSGEHAFVPPKPGDQRGPCPGLNAMANHGYIPHDGVVSLIRAVEASHEVFGMSIDLGTLLATVATIMDGNPLTAHFSIGGAAKSLNPFLLSAPKGLSGSHQKFESDASPTRADTYLNNGDSSSVNLTFFQQLYDLQPEGSPTANFDYETLIKHRVTRRQHSESKNPNFFIAVFSGFLGTPAAYSFIPRFMSNHSAEAPDGVLDHEVLKSFYGVSGSGKHLTYQPGYERIPENWYKRNSVYHTIKFLADLIYAGKEHHEFFSIGGNTGTVNSFAGIDVNDITGGIYNTKNLFEGNHFICFAFQASRQLIPDVLEGVVGDLTSVFGLWQKTVTPILGALGCPELTKFDPTVFGQYPGAAPLK